MRLLGSRLPLALSPLRSLHNAFAVIALAFLAHGAWGADRIVLTWEDNSSDEHGFRIERAMGNGRFEPVAIVEADVVEFVDLDVTRGVEYAYRVCAFNPIGDSPFSNVVRTGFLSRITNMSFRSTRVSESSALTVGFVIGAASAKSILIRGIGPTLAQFGLSEFQDDPTLSVFAGPQLVDANDNWETAENVSQVRTATARVGGFPLLESGLDAALLSRLPSGPYSVQVRGKTSRAADTLLEIYDADSNYSVRLVNFSIRLDIRTGVSSETVGFVVAGNNSKRILLRAVGPTLANYGVNNALVDPRLAIYRLGNLSAVAENDDWGSTDEIKSAFAETAAFGLNEGSFDAALLLTLEPGAYTAEITGVNRGSGAALLEVYELP